MSKADVIFKNMCRDIIENGFSDEKQEVRPRWEDGTPAHTIKKFGVVNRYNLKDEFYFVNVTNIKDDENFYKEINNTFNTKLINNIPCILHFKNNELKKVIYNKDLNKTYTNFENLLKENEFDKE